MLMQAQTDGASTAPSHSQPWHFKGVRDQDHTLATLP
jgi:hypothetical protein